MDLRTALVVGVGAAFGGIVRYLVTQLVITRFGAPNAPYATLVINVSGSFIIGIIIALAQARADFPPLWRYFLATGIVGGYTTFSTFSFEAFSLAATGSASLAAAYVVASVGLGIGGALLGVLATRAFIGAS